MIKNLGGQESGCSDSCKTSSVFNRLVSLCAILHWNLPVVLRPKAAPAKVSAFVDKLGVGVKQNNQLSCNRPTWHNIYRFFVNACIMTMSLTDAGFSSTPWHENWLWLIDLHFSIVLSAPLSYTKVGHHMSSQGHNYEKHQCRQSEAALCSAQTSKIPKQHIY